MNLSLELSKHIKHVYFGGNWTGVSLKELLEDVNLDMANRTFGTLNTINVLLHHMHYYVRIQLKVMNGAKLNGSDKDSFECTPMKREEDWMKFKELVFSEAELFCKSLVELPNERLAETFVDEKYGTYYRNIQGNLEHLHYHLGQISLLKKLIQSASGS
ncbi:MAG TPA: DUF1572 domain-containing protein [Bacteroidia bacterium]|nr:DUF1572 domain-containing protein [Bacteroidia bacterium]HNT80578.1 DUF1572 domain-containing protein [Bacteroidia bacterium]